MPLEISPYLTSSYPLKALDIRVVRGANAFAWSPVVRLTLDLGEYDEVFTNTIDGFFDALKALLPSLYEHHCSVGTVGGFFQRMIEGTLLGHVLEHIALELQVLAGMDVTFGKTRSTGEKGVYSVVFSYFYEEAGVFAAKAALNIVNALLLKETIEIPPIVKHLRSIAQRFIPGFTTQELLTEARRRRIPLTRLHEGDVESFWLGTGKYSRRFENGLLVPSTLQANNEGLVQTQEHIQILEQDITKACIRTLHLPFASSIYQPSNNILTNSYRVLLLDGVAPSVLKLAPPIVEGNGVASIEELVETMNVQRRLSGRLKPITLDGETNILLSEAGFSRDAILPKGYVVRLKREGTPENGGAVIEMNDEVCSENKALFTQIAEFIRTKFGYEMAELRITAPSLHRPLLDNTTTTPPAVMISCALQPDMRLYRLPTSGKTYNIAQHLLSTVFPPNKPSRVPIIAITGGFGADFLQAMLDDALTDLGFTVGSASPDAASIHREKLSLRAQNGILTILAEPDIDCAVLEIPLETITQEGLCYDRADVGVVLNIAPITSNENSAEHNDNTLETSEDAAHAHALVAEYLVSGGTAILNANNPIITRSVERYDHETIFFATARTNPQLALHCSRGGKALLLENGVMMLLEGKQETPFVRGIVLEAALDKELVLALTATLLAFNIPTYKVRQWLENTLERLFTQNVHAE